MTQPTCPFGRFYVLLICKLWNPEPCLNLQNQSSGEGFKNLSITWFLRYFEFLKDKKVTPC